MLELPPPRARSALRLRPLLIAAFAAALARCGSSLASAPAGARAVVAGLKEVQEKQGDGYLSALEGGRECFAALRNGKIRGGGFDLNGLWSPWYTLHKTYAGLRDAYRHAGLHEALEVEVKFAEWAEGILSGLSEKEVQRMLRTEFGGMNEVLVDLWADTGDRRWLELSTRFEDRSLTRPLARHRDVLAGKHGNTQVPKLVGSAERYRYARTPEDLLTPEEWKAREAARSAPKKEPTE